MKNSQIFIQSAFPFPTTDTNLMKTPIKYLPYFWTFKSHSLKISFVVIVKESQSFTTICVRIKTGFVLEEKRAWYIIWKGQLHV